MTWLLLIGIRSKPGGLDLSRSTFRSVEMESLDRDLNKNLGHTAMSRCHFSRPTFYSCREFLDGRHRLLEVLRSRVSIETMSRQIETPRLNQISFALVYQFIKTTGSWDHSPIKRRLLYFFLKLLIK
jgi:hypothetical protein